MQEEAVVGRDLLDDLIPGRMIHVQQPGHQFQSQRHGGCGLPVVVFVAHACRFGQHADQIDAAGVPDGLPQHRRVVAADEAQVFLHVLAVDAPAEHTGIGAGMRHAEALAAIGLIFNHKHRHAGGHDAGGRVAAVVVLGRGDPDLPAQHHLPGLVHILGQAVVAGRAADRGFQRDGQIFRLDGRAGNQNEIRLHAGHRFQRGQDVRPDRAALGHDLDDLCVGRRHFFRYSHLLFLLDDDAGVCAQFGDRNGQLLIFQRPADIAGLVQIFAAGSPLLPRDRDALVRE